jgi:hypothetical protein
MDYLPFAPQYFALFAIIIPILVVWSAVWKAFALWRAARNHHLA